jgi:hypothetical protein
MKAIITKSFKKIQTSHEIMAYHFNYYLHKDDKNHMVCDNPEWENELNTIKQALTNYANMVESLEGLREKMKEEYNRLDNFNYVIDTNLNLGNFEQLIADITKVLEGKKNETD